MKKITEQRLIAWVTDEDSEALDDFDKGYASAKAFVTEMLESKGPLRVKDMTLEDHFALEAMKSFLSSSDGANLISCGYHSIVAERSYKLARELLSARGD